MSFFLKKLSHSCYLNFSLFLMKDWLRVLIMLVLRVRIRENKINFCASIECQLELIVSVILSGWQPTICIHARWIIRPWNLNYDKSLRVELLGRGTRFLLLFKLCAPINTVIIGGKHAHAQIIKNLYYYWIILKGNGKNYPFK